DWSMLKCAVGGGTAVQEAGGGRWVKTTGSGLTGGYGLSGTSPVLDCKPPFPAEMEGTIRLPVPATGNSNCHDGNNAVPLGEPGEICARGPQIMPSYWKRPEETANVMTPDGFFRTGDIGIMDETGRTRIVDRKKDMISVSGFKVYPSEVEAV